MKLISLNVGIKIDNSKDVGEFLNSENPDFVALQEVVKHHEDSVFELYKSKKKIEMALRDKLPNKFFGPLFMSNAYMNDGKVHRDFGGLIEQGNEILSKFPIVGASNEFYYKQYAKGPLNLNEFLREDLARSVVVVEFNVEGKRLQILNVHGIWSKDKKDNKNKIDQCKYIIKAAKRKDIPTIVVGDFNLSPDTESIKLFDKEFRNLVSEFKIKTTRPPFKDNIESGSNIVDYVFVNDKLKVKNFKVIESKISDHYPLLLDFDIL